MSKKFRVCFLAALLFFSLSVTRAGVLDDVPKPSLVLPILKAEFPGGTTRFKEWLVANISYPKDAYKKKVEGEVLVSFDILRDGQVGNVKLLQGVYPSIDEEVLQCFEKSPRWIPARFYGRACNVTIVVCVEFKRPKKR